MRADAVNGIVKGRMTKSEKRRAHLLVSISATMARKYPTIVANTAVNIEKMNVFLTISVTGIVPIDLKEKCNPAKINVKMKGKIAKTDI